MCKKTNPEESGWKKVKGKKEAMEAAQVSGKMPKKTGNRKIWPVNGTKGWYWTSKIGGTDPNLLEKEEKEKIFFVPSERKGQTKVNKAIPMIAANI